MKNLGGDVKILWDIRGGFGLRATKRSAGEGCVGVKRDCFLSFTSGCFVVHVPKCMTASYLHSNKRKRHDNILVLMAFSYCNLL